MTPDNDCIAALDRILEELHDKIYRDPERLFALEKDVRFIKDVLQNYQRRVSDLIENNNKLLERARRAKMRGG